MSGSHRTGSNRHFRHRFWWRALHRTVAFSAMLFLIAEISAVAVSTLRPNRAEAATPPTGQGFTVTTGDLKFILKQINIAERHSATLSASHPCDTQVASPDDGIPDAEQIPDRLTSYGLRTVDGSCNDLIPGRETFAAADQPFPRLTKPVFRSVEPVRTFPVPSDPSYKGTGNVVDSQPRVISNLIVDQTSTNPAAVQAAGFPVRSQLHPTTPVTFPCTKDPVLDVTPTQPGVPEGCTPQHSTLFIPNVTTDVGLSPPYNSLFTFFGQFFDHGVDQTVKSGAAVFVPLKPDDPLITLGPDGKPNTGDEVKPSQAFMVLTRAQNQPGADGILGTADDVQDATNTDSPWVDQSQTYTSHPSHQVFLREYNLVAGKPVDTGKLLGGTGNGATGMATWASVKAQAEAKLGLRLVDRDVLDIPMLATDPYGNFIPGPARGLPQYVLKDGTLVEGNIASPVPAPANVRHFDTPFLTDIAHNADPSPQDTDNNPATPPVAPGADPDNTIQLDFTKQAPGTYDDELLDTHFAAGDGRVNENIALSAIHQIFHSEHDRLVDDIDHTLKTDTSPEGVAALAQWQRADGPSKWNYGQRLFQAARFVTEMEYQHLVFEEFARKVQPAIRPFHVYNPDVNPAIPAEFAHAVYRFGHSMLDDTVARQTETATGAKTDNSLPLLKAFLSPPEYFNASQSTDAADPAAPKYTPEQAAGAIVMGSTDQTGNELDEFVTETLRNNLLGLPLDLPAINMTRAREAGVPPLNSVRRIIHNKTNDAQMAPYTDWSDFGQHLKHPESLVNFVAAYGTHPTITSATTVAGKRAAARAIVDPLPTDVQPADAADFMFGTGAYANNADGTTKTGLDDVDLWVGGLAEVTNLNGGLLGSTFNYVFQNTLENLQDNDRFYYLNRTPGMNLRTQLEGNSFAEMIQRNTTGTHTLKQDVFATADCKFELSAIGFPFNGTNTLNADGLPVVTGAGSVNDDPNTDCDENQLLLRKADGTIQYRARNAADPSGINGQSVYNGTGGVDRIFGGNDNDTIYGAASNDILEGNGGDDVTLGGDGNDIITDLDGADVLKGGEGNDALDGGPGDDVPMGGNGADFILGGANDNESFAAEGNDFINAGQGADAVFGDGGDDWIQGGTGQDLLQGDHGAPFFDDPAETKPGNDVFVGQVGENDYDTEGGDDLMAQNAAIDRNAGAGGFDWAFHQYDTVGGDDDMQINQQLAGLPLPVVVNRDRWQETEADSGSPFNDVIKGDDTTPATVGTAGFTGCDALDQAGLDRISGLAAIVPSLTANPAPAGVVSAASVAAASETGVCPLSGNVWGDGNILLGGAGGDTIEGRGGNDIIDGDRALHTRLSVRDPANRAVEVGTTDLMEGKPLNRDLTPNPTGNFGPGTDGMTLQQAVFAGKVDPGDIVAVREIVTESTTPGTIDTAVFSGPRSNYTITPTPAATTITVTQTGANVAGQKASDGTDTLRNVERLRFNGAPAGVFTTVAPAAAVTPTNRAFRQALGTTSAAQTVTLTNSGVSSLSIASVGLSGTNAGDFARTDNCGTTLAGGASCTIAVTFSPTGGTARTRSASLVLTDNSGGSAGSSQTITLSGTVNFPSTVAINDSTPQRGQPVTATVADLNGVPATVTYQWQQSAPNAGTAGPFSAIAGANAQTFTVTPQQNNRRLRVLATFVDGDGFSESATSAVTVPSTPTANTTAAPTVIAAPTTATAPTSTPPGQALAPVPASTTTATALPVGAARILAAGASPLAVQAIVPARASTVRISVFRLSRLGKRSSRFLVAKAFRTISRGKRYVLRLTEKPLRSLKPGRYLIEIRVGTSRQALGPATSRVITIRRRKAKVAG
jgi:Ca2+-binding RTX toxin-like protein